MHDDHQFYISDLRGNIRLNSKGIRWFKNYFARAGIDIETIKTVQAFEDARDFAADIFSEQSDWPY